MSYSSIIVFGLALLCHSITACDQSKKTVVNVDLYYESLCRDSMNFISTQLVPNYDALKDHLKINFIPYGKSTYKKSDNDDKFEFTCHHGPDECSGNRIQACAIQIINQNNSTAEADRQKQTVDFIGCVMSKNPVTAFKQCATETKLGDPMTNEIAACAESAMGDQLLIQHGEKTASLKPPITFVPTIVINDNYAKDYQSPVLQGFRQYICNFLANDCDASGICETGH